MTVTCPHCGCNLIAEEQWLGQSVDCPNCQESFMIPAASSNSPFENSEISHRNTNKEYKVLTQKDKWFSGKFDPEKLEGAINAYAKQGWKFVGCATASMPSVIGGNREEMIIIMERS